MVNQNLFLHDLAIVSLIKDGAHHYLKEWLDYHLGAGADHFFIYDAANSEETREVLKPYIDAHWVNYFPVSNDGSSIAAYNDAVRRFKFVCRYMAFIDLDEFIFPKTGQSIVEVVDELLEEDSSRAALAVNRQVFGSNRRYTADYSKGVLERFIRRAPSNWFEPAAEDKLPLGNIHVRTIANPRYIRYIVNPHYAYYFDGKFAVNSAGGRVNYWDNEPILADKIVVNQYFVKSREEFKTHSDDMNVFYKNDRNDEKDEDIIAYRALRMENFTPPKARDRDEYFHELEKVLLPAVRQDTPQEFFDGKLETFLTCRALAGILRRTFPKDGRGQYMEEAALRAINRTHAASMTLADTMLMLNALPQILVLPYPVVADIHKNCMNFVRQIIGESYRTAQWEQFVDMGNYLEMLSAFGVHFKDQEVTVNPNEPAI